MGGGLDSIDLTLALSLEEREMSPLADFPWPPLRGGMREKRGIVVKVLQKILFL
jgi:hypothetical protein